MPRAKPTIRPQNAPGCKVDLGWTWLSGPGPQETQEENCRNLGGEEVGDRLSFGHMVGGGNLDVDEQLAGVEVTDDGDPGDTDTNLQVDLVRALGNSLGRGQKSVQPPAAHCQKVSLSICEGGLAPLSLVQISMVNMVDDELKMEVREDMRAAIITASIMPRAPGQEGLTYGMTCGHEI